MTSPSWTITEFSHSQRGIAMTIRREALHSVDFSDIETGEIIQPVHPGAVLRAEFLTPYNMSVNALAMALRVPAPRINDVVRGQRGISPDTALRLARYFRTSPDSWMNLQVAYALRKTAIMEGETIAREVDSMPA
ncbi:MAG: HigA family addiction module antitoxin [Janthinobacterium lividum]